MEDQSQFINSLSFFYNLDLWHFYILESGLSYFLYLFICLLFVSVADVTALVYFVSAAGCHCVEPMFFFILPTKALKSGAKTGFAE